MVAIKILRGVLQLAVNGLVQIFQKRHFGRLRPLEMRFDIFDKDSETLRPKTELPGSGGMLVPSTVEHDPRFASAHLRAANGIAIAVVLDEAECPAKPGYCFLDVLIGDVGKYRVGGYGAI